MQFDVMKIIKGKVEAQSLAFSMVFVHKAKPPGALNAVLDLNADYDRQFSEHSGQFAVCGV